MKSILLVLPLYFAFGSAQFFYHQQHRTPGLQVAFPQQQHYQEPAIGASQQYAHQSVIDNSVRESMLPPELRKSDRFYNNPRIAAALAKESWFTNQEMPVHDREAEKIPRDMVFKLFKNAGYIKRR